MVACHMLVNRRSPRPSSTPQGPHLASLQLLPMGNSTLLVWVYGSCFFTWGLMISWVAPACNSPIFAEVVRGGLVV